MAVRKFFLLSSLTVIGGFAGVISPLVVLCSSLLFAATLALYGPPKAIRLSAALCALGCLPLLWVGASASAQQKWDRFTGATSSQPLALTADGETLVVANPDNDSVTFFDVKDDKNRRIEELRVGQEPNGVAVMPDGRWAYAANTVSGTVSVIRFSNGTGRVVDTIEVGTEPYALVLTPNATKLYCANARSNSVSVIDTETNQVVKTIQNVGLEPRGMAVTNDDDGEDRDETLYVTQFLSLPVEGKLDGSDDSKEGHVTAISTNNDTIIGEVLLKPLADSGFKAAGDALQRIAPGANFTFTTGAYPNQLNNIAVKGNFAFVPNTGASPNGPVRFDVNTQSLISSFNRSTLQDTGRTINMHTAVAAQTNPARRFITVPWAMAIKHKSDEAFVVSAASNIAVKLAVNLVNGAATVQSDVSDPTRVLQIRTGKNPRGIVINEEDTRAYVMNYVSRDVTVIDLSTAPEKAIATLASASLPEAGTLAEKIQIGKELYHTSIGEFDRPTPFHNPIVGRMSNNGWGSCSSCHPFGLTDNVVWIFPPGPRKTIPQHTDFDQTDATRKTMRVLNWSGERDEEEDFELNIRAVSGGQGLIVQADDQTQDTNVVNLTPVASGGRNQLTVRGVPAWDAIKAYEQFGIRGPIAPNTSSDPDVAAGRALFIAANCQQCHGGPQWTSARVRFNPPPAADQIVAGQLVGELRKVGTFDAAAFNEVRQNAGAPLGADGFVPPSLLSTFAFPKTFLHNGAATTLGEVLNNVQHRAAGTGGVDTLSNAADRAMLVKFVESIDSKTEPIPIP